MTTTPFPSPARSLAQVILYILAGLVLLLGLIAGLSLITGAASMVANLLLPLQLLGAAAAANLIGPMLTGFVINLGVAALLFSLALSALLYTAGRLVGRIARLEARLSQLEARPWLQ